MNNYLNYKDEFKAKFKEMLIFQINKKVDVQFDFLYEELLKLFFIKELDHVIKNELTNWFNEIYNQKSLNDLIDNSIFNEIIFNNEKTYLLKYKEEKNNYPFHILSAEDFQISLEIWALKESKNWNTLCPFVSFDYQQKAKQYRLTLVHPELSPKKETKLFIRSLSEENKNLELFSDDQECISILNNLILEHQNVLISGSTGSGKTTLLNTLLNATPNEEHTIIIEDTHEIRAKKENCSYLLANDKIKGQGLEEYCAYAMRMSPDRMILGEMRSREVVPFLLAMNSGHKGLLTTIHANSAYDSLTRVQTLFGIYGKDVEINSDFVFEMICKNINYIVYLENKKVKEIIKVLGQENNQAYIETIYLKSA